ncbi:WxL protein peptidoglycan domain-containing protein [Kribbella sp. GL6]|uniref:WxL protein peptidoglycan domain-containing protein n=1 Tax=Kribbella sp. GL6 TaxID=3419765 RepID=UPI003CFC50A1
MRKVLVMLFVALNVAIGVPAAAADDVPWSVGTADNGYGAERPNYSYTLNPGGQVDDALVVTNRGTTPLVLAVYAADGFTNDRGQLDLRAKDAKSTDLGAWVHAAQSQATVLPGKSVQVPFTLTIPADATAGDHLGGIITSLAQAGDVDRRLAIRIRVRVSGELKPSAAVDDLKLRRSKSDVIVTYTVSNTGNAIVSARPSVSVAGLFGTAQAEAGDTPQLLPGESWKVSTTVREVKASPRLTGKVTLLPLLTDAAGSTGTLDTVSATTHTWSITWLASLLVLALCGATVIVVRRRGAADPGSDADDRHDGHDVPEERDGEVARQDVSTS